MKFDQKLAHHIATLAKLDINHPSLSHIIDDMQRILAMVEIMDKVNTDAIEPLYHPITLPKNQREDIVYPLPKSDQDNILHNAPQANDGLFVVPQVIE